MSCWSVMSAMFIREPVRYDENDSFEKVADGALLLMGGVLEYGGGRRGWGMDAGRGSNRIIRRPRLRLDGAERKAEGER